MGAVVGSLAQGAQTFWAAIVLRVATLIVLGTLIYKARFAPKQITIPDAGTARPRTGGVIA